MTKIYNPYHQTANSLLIISVLSSEMATNKAINFANYLAIVHSSPRPFSTQHIYDSVHACILHD